MTQKISYRIFDCHFHIIDRRFPLVPNNGYLPDDFHCDDYLERLKSFDLAGGAIVSGSFQAFDQTYLLDALRKLGPGFVGVTQLPASVSDDELLRLNGAGVRAIRFNLKRGGSERVENLESFAKRVHEVAGWHVELYIDSRDLPDLQTTLTKLPTISIDHLGLSKVGFNTLLKLVEHGVHVKATGFGRVDFDVKEAMRRICSINPDALMFGTDLPSTRATRPYTHDDIIVVVEALGEKIAQKVFCDNATNFYHTNKIARNV